MKKIFKLLAALLLIPTLLFAQPHGGQVTIGGSPGMTAFTGYKLTFATQGPQDIQWLTNNTVRMELDGSTGVLSGASGGVLSVNLALAATSTFSTLTISGTQGTILSGTTDTADNATLSVTPGGALGITRGPFFEMYGNEVTTTGGKFRLDLGDTSTATLDLQMENAASSVRVRDTTTGTLWSFLNNADLSSDATNGGNLILNAQDKALQILSGASIPASVTTIAPATNTTGYYASNSSGNLVGYIANIADASGTQLNFMKTRAAAGTLAATTIVNSGDNVLNITGYGANGTSYDALAAILMNVGGTPGATNDMPGSMVFRTTPDGSATLTTALTIGSDQSATFTGAITSSIATTIGWSVVDQTDNQACNTGCTSGCVIGIDNATGSAVTNLVSCAATTADLCVCAGAS